MKSIYVLTALLTHLCHARIGQDIPKSLSRSSLVAKLSSAVPQQNIHCSTDSTSTLHQPCPPKYRCVRTARNAAFGGSMPKEDLSAGICRPSDPASSASPSSPPPPAPVSATPVWDCLEREASKAGTYIEVTEVCRDAYKQAASKPPPEPKEQKIHCRRNGDPPACPSGMKCVPFRRPKMSKGSAPKEDLNAGECRPLDGTEGKTVIDCLMREVKKGGTFEAITERCRQEMKPTINPD